MFVLDTDILIDIQRGYQPALDWFSEQPETPAVPGFVVMELCQDARNKQELQQAQKLIEPLHLIWPTKTECDFALAIFQSYHLSHGLGLLDALIASCANGQDNALCTFNVKHYRCIPDLNI